MKLPKPKECGQNWDEMEETPGGRLCGQCEKVIVDFRKMNWSDIRAIQNATNHSTCGIYSDKQIKNWDPDPKKRSLTNSAAAVLLTLSQLVSTEAEAQAFYVQTDTTLSPTTDKDSTSTPKTTPFIIKGTILDKETGEAIPFATIRVVNKTYGTTSNMDGYYEMKVDSNAFTNGTLDLEIRYVGYEPHIVHGIIWKPAEQFALVDIKLSDKVEIIYFRVSPPKKGKRERGEAKP